MAQADVSGMPKVYNKPKHYEFGRGVNGCGASALMAR
jgi:hypothetical protein